MPPRSTTAALLGLALCAPACADDARREGTGQTSLGTLTASGTSDVGDDEESETGETRLDLGSDTGGVLGGCAKVDFLFVIDNSYSMEEYQARLVASFPGFVAAIRGALGHAQDYNIMIVDTDPAGPVQCASICGPALDSNCVSNDTCIPFDPDIPLCTQTCLDFLECVSLPGGCQSPPPPDACDILGAGIDFPRGADASNTDCRFSSGQRYIDSSEPDLDAAFACAATVGTNARGTSELPIGSMLAALDASSAAGSCNGGFLRDDAILVVTIITDEDDYPGDGTPGTVDEWVSTLTAAKHGDPSAIVMLGLFGNEIDGCGEDSERLGTFLRSWGERGRIGSICSQSYVPFFEEVVGLIDNTCDAFEPPG